MLGILRAQHLPSGGPVPLGLCVNSTVPPAVGITRGTGSSRVAGLLLESCNCQQDAKQTASFGPLKKPNSAAIKYWNPQKQDATLYEDPVPLRSQIWGHRWRLGSRAEVPGAKKGDIQVSTRSVAICSKLLRNHPGNL